MTKEVVQRLSLCRFRAPFTDIQMKKEARESRALDHQIENDKEKEQD
jgi:hypothetical protein